MKKLFVILFVFISLYSIYSIRNPKVKPVVMNNEPFNLEDYNVFYLNLEEESITTLNLKKYINNDIKIISLIPYINPIYKDKMSNLKYTFTQESFNKNITKFIEYYKNEISKSGYIDNLSYIPVNGIKINELEVYAKGSDIVNIMYQNNKIKYKILLNNEYDYFN